MTGVSKLIAEAFDMAEEEFGEHKSTEFLLQITADRLGVSTDEVVDALADRADEPERYSLTFDEDEPRRAILRVHTPDGLTSEERAQIKTMVGDMPLVFGCPYCERQRYRKHRDLSNHAASSHHRRVTKDGGPCS